MPLNITIDNDDTAPSSSRSSSITEDSSGTGVQVSPEGSQGDFSDPLDENEESWVLYPDEIGPSDSASRPRTSNQNRPIVEAPRLEPSRRQSSRRQRFDDHEHPIPLPRQRRPPLPASSGSVDSNEEWRAYGRGPPHTHGRTYAHWGHATSPPPNYATSYSSVQGYTPFPPVGQQLVPFTNPPAHYGFSSFPHSSGPSAPAYLMQGQHGGPAWGSAVAAHGGPPFGGHEIIHPAANSSYFPYAPPGYPPIPQPVVSPAVYHAYPGVYSPPPANTPPPAADSSKDDETFARIEKLFLDQKAEQEAKEAAAKQAAEEAAAKAAAEKKIAEEIAAAAAAAAAVATEEAEKKAAEKAAEEAEKAKAAADAAAEEAEKKMAEAVAAAAPPPPPPPPEERKKPIRFKDAVGRKFSFPFHLCNTWEGMEDLIRQAFLHVEVIGPHVAEGHYDLVGPNGEIILPRVWETVIEPDWVITMHMWPMPEPPKPEDPPAEEPAAEAVVEVPEKKGGDPGGLPPPPPDPPAPGGAAIVRDGAPLALPASSLVHFYVDTLLKVF